LNREFTGFESQRVCEKNAAKEWCKGDSLMNRCSLREFHGESGMLPAVSGKIACQQKAPRCAGQISHCIKLEP
jgi:hypothetical protein